MARSHRPPAPAEAQLALAGLGDLLGDALGDVLSVLPSPQADALRVALFLERPRAPLDARLLGISAVSALRALQAADPVLLAVDDAQWLDEPSAKVLAFAWRRVAGARVGLLLARRTGEPLPEGLAELESLERLVVGPLDLEDTHLVLRDRLGIVFRFRRSGGCTPSPAATRSSRWRSGATTTPTARR